MHQQFDLVGHPYVALCDLLKLSGWAQSGGEAKHLISSGQIQRNQQTEQRKTAKITAGETISMQHQILHVIDSQSPAKHHE